MTEISQLLFNFRYFLTISETFFLEQLSLQILKQAILSSWWQERVAPFTNKMAALLPSGSWDNLLPVPELALPWLQAPKSPASLMPPSAVKIILYVQNLYLVAFVLYLSLWGRGVLEPQEPQACPVLPRLVSTLDTHWKLLECQASQACPTLKDHTATVALDTLQLRGAELRLQILDLLSRTEHS